MLYNYPMNWFLLSITSVFFYSLSTIVQRLMMKGDRSNPVSYMIVFQLLTALIIFIYFVVTSRPFPNLETIWPFLLLNGVLIAVASISMFSALKYLDAGEYTVLSTLSIPINMLVANLFLKEPYTVNKLLGTSLIILSILVVSSLTKKKVVTESNNGKIYAILSGLMFGIAFASESYVVSKIGVLEDLLIGFLLPGTFVAAFKPKALIAAKEEFLNTLKLSKLLSFTLLYLFGAITLFAAYNAGGQASNIYAISNSSVILTVLLGIILLKEKTNISKKLIGAVIAFIGIILLK